MIYVRWHVLLIQSFPKPDPPHLYTIQVVQHCAVIAATAELLFSILPSIVYTHFKWISQSVSVFIFGAEIAWNVSTAPGGWKQVRYQCTYVWKPSVTTLVLVVQAPDCSRWSVRCRRNFAAPLQSGSAGPVKPATHDSSSSRQCRRHFGDRQCRPAKWRPILYAADDESCVAGLRFDWTQSAGSVYQTWSW